MMKVISTNIAKPRTIEWKGKTQETGIFKEPVEEGLFLEKYDVKDDAVVDRRYHGGLDKACYLYSADHYGFWKKEYPDLDIPYGMFGENLTVEGLDEHTMIIGDTYTIGSAIVQVSEPRQPCYKLGIRFGTQAVLKKFVKTSYSGVYVRVLKEGKVKKGDALEPFESVKEGLSIAEVYRLLYAKEADSDVMQLLIDDQWMPDKLKVNLVGKFGTK